jgi:hypothetical protein
MGRVLSPAPPPDVKEISVLKMKNNIGILERRREMELRGASVRGKSVAWQRAVSQQRTQHLSFTVLV